jgi:hypothetical protein
MKYTVIVGITVDAPTGTDAEVVVTEALGTVSNLAFTVNGSVPAPVEEE